MKGTEETSGSSVSGDGCSTSGHRSGNAAALALAFALLALAALRKSHPSGQREVR